MQTFLIFLAILYIAILPMILFINWWIFRKSFIYRSGIAIITTIFMVVPMAYFIGAFGLINLFWCVPVGTIALTLTFLYLRNSIEKPMNKVKLTFDRLTLGDIEEVVNKGKSKNDEIGRMFSSLNQFLAKLNEATTFASSIRQGDLNQPFQVLSDGDVLGKSLVALRDNLKEILTESNRVLILAGEEGNLSARIRTDGKEGAWEALCDSINGLLTSVSNPMLEFNRIVNAMAEGDLSKRLEIDAKGDIKALSDNMNSALGNLNQLLSEIANTATDIQKSAAEMQVSGNEMSVNTNEIASSIAEISNGAQSQVSKIDETFRKVEIILKMTNEMGENSDNIIGASTVMVENSKNGGDIISAMVNSIENISRYSTQTSESMGQLKLRSNQISRVTAMITEISTQTNLLALNAAIEAAQAGEAGRGFAVVAEEIRKLAEDSKNSATEIEKLIADVQMDTAKTARVIVTMGENVRNGVEASSRASKVLNDISNSSNQTLNISQQIKKATDDQSVHISNVFNLSESVVVIAEETAAGTEQIASSSTELSSGMNDYLQKTKWLGNVSEALINKLDQFTLKLA